MKFLALGGLDELGKNFYILEINHRIIILDCGLKMPSKNDLGIDYIIANINYLEKNIHRVVALVISHGHEDNCGAFPFIIDKLSKIRVFVNKLTHQTINDLIEKSSRWKLRKQDIDYVIIKSNEKYVITNDIILKTFEVQHSFPSTFNFILETSEGNILYMTDFIISSKMIWNKKIFSIPKILTESKIDLFLCDSSNFSNTGFVSPNYSIKPYLQEKLINKNYGKFIISCYSDDILYIYEIIQLSIEFNLPVFINNIRIYKLLVSSAREGYFDISKANIKTVKNPISQNAIILLIADIENIFATLNNVALGNDPNISIKEGDLFVPITRIIPGSELNAVNANNEIIRNGARIESIPISNISPLNPGQEDFRLILSTINPSVFVPIKGMYRELLIAKNIASEYMDPKNIFVLENGMFLDLNFNTNIYKTFAHKIKIHDVFIDGIGIGDVSNMIIYERELLGNNGIIIISFVYKNCKIVTNINTRIIGLPQEISNHDFYKYLEAVIENHTQKFQNNIHDIKKYIKEDAFKYIRKNFGKSPVIIPIIIKW